MNDLVVVPNLVEDENLAVEINALFAVLRSSGTSMMECPL